MEKFIKRGKVYKVSSPNSDQVYIGSTERGLSARFSKHKNAFNSYEKNPENNKYYSVFDVIRCGDAQISLIETFAKISKSDLSKKEGEAIMNHDNCCNKNIAGRNRTMHEYYLENKNALLEKMKIYVSNNKEKISEYTKEYCRAWRLKKKEEKMKLINKD
jgi:hypothetical protein